MKPITITNKVSLFTKLNQIDSILTTSNPEGTRFSWCEFKGTSFHEITFKDCEFIESDFYYCQFTDIHFINCSFKGCKFFYCFFEECSFQDCDFGVCMKSSEIIKSSFTECDLTEWAQRNTDLYAIEISSSIFDWNDQVLIKYLIQKGLDPPISLEESNLIAMIGHGVLGYNYFRDYRCIAMDRIILALGKYIKMNPKTSKFLKEELKRIETENGKSDN